MMERTRVETVEAALATERVAMERSQNELVLLRSQVEAFRELAVQTNSLARRSQEQLNASNACITWYQNQMNTMEHERESMKMLVNRYERERNIVQRTTQIPGAERLRAEMKDVME